MSVSEKINRRDFMRRSAFAAAGVALTGLGFKNDKVKVVLIRHAEVLDGEGKPVPEVLQQMVDEAVMTLTSCKEPLPAWQTLFKAEDIVGIKTNVWRYLPTPAALEDAVKKRLLEVGVDEERIGIEDRRVRTHPLFQKATALINMRPLRTHHWSGIGGCIKNYINFGEDWPSYHPDSCADLALAWKLPQVKDKTRLNILSVLTPQFHGRGPHHFDSRYLWPYKGLIVSRDPVAADAVGLKLIQAKRRLHFGEEVELETTPKHIRIADVRHGIGVSDLDKIELIKLGWQEDILI